MVPLWCFISAIETLTETDSTKSLGTLIIFLSAGTYMTRSNLREEGLALAHSLKKYSHHFGEGMTAGLCSWEPSAPYILAVQRAGSSEEAEVD